MEQSFKRDFASLDDIFRFVGRFLSDMRIEESVAFSINLAVEELFTNMVKYNAGASDEVLIRADLADAQIRLQLIDSDVDPFDPAALGEVDVRGSTVERKPGGLGLHLVRSVVDQLTYEYENRIMTVTITKRLDQKNV